MNKEESLALLAKGKDAWNAWAAERLAEREALKAAGAWVDSKYTDDWNQETRDWRDAAKVNFSSHEFEDDVNFRKFEFPYHAEFDEAVFGGDAEFRGAEFGGYAEFGGAEFEGVAEFGGAKFGGYAEFDGAKFEGVAWFGGAVFEGVAEFRGAEFYGTMFGGAEFYGAVFEGDAEFRGAEFGGDAEFRRAEFGGYAEFQESLFKGFTSFQDATFLKHASFLAARGERAFSLAGAEFLEVPDFEQAHFEEAPRLDNLRIEPGGLTPYRQNDSATRNKSRTDLAARWRALKRLAIQGHDHARELDFFRGEVKAGRWTEGNFWPSVFSYPYEWFSGFGGSLVRPIAWWISSTASFSCLYLGQQAVLNKLPVTGLGAMVTGLFSFAGAKQLDIQCTAGEGEPWLAALSLSFRKALLFSGLDTTGKLSQVYGCLYGIYPKGEAVRGDLPGSFAPIIPSFISFLGLAQLLLSSILIFLFLLAVRNHFRIR